MTYRGAPTAVVLGKVRSFDVREGLGELELEDGRTLGFHATSLADGTRDVAVGTEVAATVVAGRRGRYEAASITSR